jgi:two-component system sensor histidine kinase UhpB
MDTIVQRFDVPHPDAIKPSVQRDLLVVAGVTIATFLLSIKLNLTEHVLALTRPFEAYQLDELPITFAAMIVALAWFSWRRSRQVVEQMNLRLEAQQALADALAENRMLSQRYLEAQEEERRHLARELHDELGQSLNAIKVDAVNIREQSADVPNVRRSAQAIIDVSTQVYQVVRSLTRRLRPVALDELGLSSAVQYLVDDWQRRHKEVSCTFSSDSELEGLEESVNITAYRLVQECLTNVTKHAGAHKVDIAIERRTTPDRGSALSISVADDGRGFDPALPRHGLGLVGLRERVEALGGRFEVSSAPGRGMRVAAVIPLDAAK